MLLYIHGYNQTFETAMLDAARLASGLRFAGETVLFSWPSHNKLFDYMADRESAMWSRDALEVTLDSLIGRSGAGRINIVGGHPACLPTRDSRLDLGRNPAEVCSAVHAWRLFQPADLQ